MRRRRHEYPLSYRLESMDLVVGSDELTSDGSDVIEERHTQSTLTCGYVTRNWPP